MPLLVAGPARPRAASTASRSCLSGFLFKDGSALLNWATTESTFLNEFVFEEEEDEPGEFEVVAETCPNWSTIKAIRRAKELANEVLFFAGLSSAGGLRLAGAENLNGDGPFEGPSGGGGGLPLDEEEAIASLWCLLDWISGADLSFSGVGAVKTDLWIP